MSEEVLDKRRRISKKGLLFISSLCLLTTIYLWLDRYFHFSAAGFRNAKFPYFEIMFTSMTVVLFMSLFKPTKALQVIAFIIAIPLLPMFIIGILSQTKPLASLTLPMMVFPLLASATTYLFGLLEHLHLGTKFDTQVIPYLNLTTILVMFAYFDKFFIKLSAKLVPESQMPNIVKEWTYELIDKKIFLKFAYLVLTILIVFTTAERLYGQTIINVLPTYKQIAFESLLSFIAIDRLIGKWKTK